MTNPYQQVGVVIIRTKTHAEGGRMTNQSRNFLPNKALGWWSVGLIIAMPLLFLIGGSLTNTLYESVQSGDTIFADIAARPALALLMLAGMGAGISAFITGLVAIIRHKERGVLVFISTVIGALLILFLFAEILFPH